MIDFFNENDERAISEIMIDNFLMESENIKSIPDAIENVVKIIERKGYKVKYASPGYVDSRFKGDRNKDGILNGKFVTSGRIIFEKDYKFATTPEGWKWKVLENGNKALYVHQVSKHSDGNTEKELRDWYNTYMKGIKNWANSLPKMGESDEVKKEDENFKS